MLANDTSTVAAFDFSTMAGPEGARERIKQESGGRHITPNELNMAVQFGHLHPVLVAGRRLYTFDDLDAFAKKWGERKVKRKTVPA